MSTSTRQASQAAVVTPPAARLPATARSPWRLPAVAALLLVAGTVMYLATRPASYHYRLDFLDAGQLVPGDLVRIGGTAAGAVDGLKLTPDGLAEVDVSIDSGFGPLRQGTTARIRAQGLAGVASRYVDVSPAPTFKRALPDNGLIPASQTSGIVDIDELFNALDANTRQGLRRLIQGFAGWYRGKSAQAASSTRYFPPALQAYSRLFAQIDADTPILEEFLTKTSAALAAIDRRSTQVTDLISQARATAQAIGSNNQALSQALVNLPGALQKGSTTLARVRVTTLPALAHLVGVIAPVTPMLAPFLTQLQPLLDEAPPTLAQLREVFSRPGPHNDLYDALVELPSVANQVTHDFPRAIRAVTSSTPVFEFARPYIPDLVAWLANWDGIFAPYDANGHYARTVPAFDAFSFIDDPQGGTLIPRPPNLRGSGGALRTGFLHRCPGGAIVPPADRSAPFIDSGPLSNSHCRASETIGGTP